MSYLTVRAEQALIGAMLAEQPLPGELRYLQADDFGHRVLRQIYAAVFDLREATPHVELPDAVADRLDTPGVDAAWLRELRDACPSAGHIAAYARMVQVSAFRREIAMQGERIAATAAAGHTTDGAYQRMAGALSRQSEVHAAFTALDQTQALRLPQATPAPPDTNAGDRDRREDELLADLLAHPEQARDLARFVEPDAFTSEQRYEVFTTLVMLAEAGDPIDEIILGWEIERQRAAADLYDVSRFPDTYPEPTPVYLARLASTTVAAGTAITIGHELAVADTRAKLDAAVAASQHRQALGTQTSLTAEPARAPQLDPNLIPPPAPAPGHQPGIER